jgi:hypothetical protein
MITFVALLGTTQSRLALSTSTGTRIRCRASVVSTASSAASLFRITLADTPDIARSSRDVALDGDFEPHINGARTQRGNDFNGK